MKIHITILAVLAGILVFALAACSGGSADPLNGTAWGLASLDGAAPIEGTTITLVFQDGSVSGSSGCNSYGGKYEINSDQIQISEVTSTLMACMEPEGAMDQEAAFLGALNNAETFQLSGSQLQITTSDGIVLTFDPQP